MSHLNVSASSRRRVLAGALATTLLAPAPAAAFFQQTKLEGAVGTDLGGVWISTHQVMPEFRITFPKPATGPAVPFAVGPIPADLEPVTGKPAAGVSITECTNSTFCAEYGLLVGDIIVKVSASEIRDVSSFEKALENLPPNVLLSVRRPALRMTTARLFKIKYAREGKETEDASIEQEQVDVKVLDVKLPFAGVVEATRKSHELFEPSADDLKTLSTTWAQLPQNDPLLLMTGKYRFVAQASFDEALAADAILKNAKYALVMDMDANPTRGGGGKLIDIYGIETVDGDTMEGTYVTVTIASAPFPINVEFKGRFRMKRVAPWSDEDERIRAKLDSQKKAPEDLNKFKTLPDVPPDAKPAGKE